MLQVFSTDFISAWHCSVHVTVSINEGSRILITNSNLLTSFIFRSVIDRNYKTNFSAFLTIIFVLYRLDVQGLKPPNLREKDLDFDPGCKFHVANNVPYIRYVPRCQQRSIH